MQPVSSKPYILLNAPPHAFLMLAYFYSLFQRKKNLGKIINYKFNLFFYWKFLWYSSFTGILLESGIRLKIMILIFFHFLLLTLDNFLLLWKSYRFYSLLIIQLKVFISKMCKNTPFYIQFEYMRLLKK